LEIATESSTVQSPPAIETMRGGSTLDVFQSAGAGECFNNLLRPMLHLNQTMLSWEPERIIFAHGPWHDANGTTELRNAFRWLLK
jgi:hypothetical protein